MSKQQPLYCAHCHHCWDVIDLQPYEPEIYPGMVIVCPDLSCLHVQVIGDDYQPRHLFEDEVKAMLADPDGRAAIRRMQERIRPLRSGICN